MTGDHIHSPFTHMAYWIRYAAKILNNFSWVLGIREENTVFLLNFLYESFL